MRKLTLLIILAFSASAFAGDSGCGLGSVIIQKNSKLLQLLSMTTNSFFFTQPLGITSGTSGCSASGLVQNDKELQYFVEINNDDISREMARGEGEKMEILAQLNGCTNPEAQKAFLKMTQGSYQDIYPSPEEKAENVVMRIKDKMKSDSEVQRMCSVAAL
jgi:hypothetical protein